MTKSRETKKQPWKPGDPKPHQEEETPKERYKKVVEEKVPEATLAPQVEEPPPYQPPPPEPEPEKTPHNLVDQIHLALFGLQVEVQGGIPSISHKCLTENGITTIVKQLQDKGVIK